LHSTSDGRTRAACQKAECPRFPCQVLAHGVCLPPSSTCTSRIARDLDMPCDSRSNSCMGNAPRYLMAKDPVGRCRGWQYCEASPTRWQPLRHEPTHDKTLRQIRRSARVSDPAETVDRRSPRRSETRWVDRFGGVRDPRRALLRPAPSAVATRRRDACVACRATGLRGASTRSARSRRLRRSGVRFSENLKAICRFESRSTR
jgi:hypothetical protein